LMDTLYLPEKGASWPNKPPMSHHINAFVWHDGDEDSEENRVAFLTHLKDMLQIPENYNLADVLPEKHLLSVELFQGVPGSRKISGTTDVAIAKARHVRNRVVRNNIETLLELKTPKNIKKKDHTPQTICKHFAASYLNPDHAVVSVLTDLSSKWIFFWYAIGEEDSKMSLYRLMLDGKGAAAEAKYLLDSLYDSSVGDALPATFAERQPLNAVLNDLVSRKRRRMDLDGPNVGQNSKPSLLGGAEQYPDPITDSLSESSAQQSNQRVTGGGGSASIRMAHALSLFAPPADRDVANELDLLDMVEPDQQYEIVSSFASKHIVPYMHS